MGLSTLTMGAKSVFPAEGWKSGVESKKLDFWDRLGVLKFWDLSFSSFSLQTEASALRGSVGVSWFLHACVIPCAGSWDAEEDTDVTNISWMRAQAPLFWEVCRRVAAAPLS